jgi:hypothetical protein
MFSVLPIHRMFDAAEGLNEWKGDVDLIILRNYHDHQMYSTS